MTVASTTRRNDYVGNDNVSAYSYSFKIFVNTHLRVTVRNLSNEETTLALTTDYTVSGVGETAGGSITLVDADQAWLTASGKLKSGYILTIRRILPLLQAFDIRNQGSYFPESHENQFDKTIHITQQHQDEIDRAMKLPETVDPSTFDADLPVPVASKYLRVNAAGTGLELVSVETNPADIEIVTGDADKILSVLTNETGFELLSVAAAVAKFLTTRGDIAYRGATAAQRLAVGAANTILKSDGTDPAYSTLTALLDALFSSAQGAILYRGASAWAALAPGTSGYFLKTLGAAANPAWDAVSSLESGTWGADLVGAASRAKDTIYQNTSGKKRRVLVSFRVAAAIQGEATIGTGSASPPATVASVVGIATNGGGGSGATDFMAYFEVPASHYYRVLESVATITLNTWYELDE